MSVGSPIIIDGLARLDEDEVLEDDDEVPEVGGSVLLGPLPDFDADRSVATTQLATEVGSVLGAPKTPFLKSFTVNRRKVIASLQPDDEGPAPTALVDWGSVEVKDVKVKRKTKVVVRKLDGLIANEFSGIKEGDYIYSVDLERVSGWDAEQVQTALSQPSELPYFCLATTFPMDNDIWVQATIMKPDPDMTLAQLGMTVWYWGYVSTSGMWVQGKFPILSCSFSLLLTTLLRSALHQGN